MRELSSSSALSAHEKNQIAEPHYHGRAVASTQEVMPWKEPVACLNLNTPEIVFISNGDVVVAEIS